MLLQRNQQVAQELKQLVKQIEAQAEVNEKL
jgi:hypothetical protein